MSRFISGVWRAKGVGVVCGSCGVYIETEFSNMENTVYGAK